MLSAITITYQWAKSLCQSGGEFQTLSWVDFSEKKCCFLLRLSYVLHAWSAVVGVSVFAKTDVTFSCKTMHSNVKKHTQVEIHFQLTFKVVNSCWLLFRWTDLSTSLAVKWHVFSIHQEFADLSQKMGICFEWQWLISEFRGEFAGRCNNNWNDCRLVSRKTCLPANHP